MPNRSELSLCPMKSREFALIRRCWFYRRCLALQAYNTMWRSEVKRKDVFFHPPQPRTVPAQPGTWGHKREREQICKKREIRNDFMRKNKAAVFRHRAKLDKLTNQTCFTFLYPLPFIPFLTCFPFVPPASHSPVHLSASSRTLQFLYPPNWT